MHQSIGRLGIVLAFLVISISLKAQTSFKTIDALTYDLYQQANWERLVQVGDSLIDSGTDYYYLRLRMGLAHYFLQEQLLAIPHFKAAYAFNAAEEVAQEHLYYCYFQTGQYGQALKIISETTPFLQEKVGADKGKIVPAVALRGGVKGSNSADIPAALELDADVHFTLFRKVNWKVSFNQITQTADFWGIKQQQYYTSFGLPLAKDWNITTGISFLHYDYELKLLPSTLLFEGQALALGISADKLTRKHQFGIGYSGMFADSSEHHQAQVNYAFFPFGNTKLYLGTEIYLSNEGTADFAIAFKPYLSYSLTPKFRLSSLYLQGGGHNLLQQNAEIINNNYDITSSLFEAGLNYQLVPKLNLGLFYQLESKIGGTTADYQYNSLFINLKFTP